MNFKIADCENSLITGAGHGIGLAFCDFLLNNTNSNIHAVYRDESKAQDLITLQKKFSARMHIYKLDMTKEESAIALKDKLKNLSIKMDLAINCIGKLHDENISPEKSLRSINEQSFLEITRVNTLPSLWIAKHLESLFSRNTLSMFITISAKVGSIEDNKMGGWYSYRASKAALNMLLKNISIEFMRKKNNIITMAIHPGTTKTELSEPFIARTNYKLHSPEETATNILNLIDNRSLNDNGKFLSWDGEELKW